MIWGSSMPVFGKSPNSWRLSTPNKTRQTRQMEPNPLIPYSNPLSGRPDFPTNNPTFSPRLPDIFVLIICRLWQEGSSREMQHRSGRATESSPYGQRLAFRVNRSQQTLRSEEHTSELQSL